MDKSRLMGKLADSGSPDLSGWMSRFIWFINGIFRINPEVQPAEASDPE